jgi:UPF0176 protein
MNYNLEITTNRNNNNEINDASKLYSILAFYYISSDKKEKNFFKDLENRKIFFKNLSLSLSIKGTILISFEGLNGTISGEKENINKFLKEIKIQIEKNNNDKNEDKGFFDNEDNIDYKENEYEDKYYKNNLNQNNKRIFEYKISYSEFVPFSKLKILVKKEVVALQSDIDELDFSLKPINLNSFEWDELVYSNSNNSENNDSCYKNDTKSDNDNNKEVFDFALNLNKDIQLIDTRNDYEFKIGTFKGAIDPNIQNFREFKDYLKEAVENGDLDMKKPCAIFCTGGIRCEKAGIYMRNIGFEKVYQLEGGILKYFEETGNENKNWAGDCFVFDDRVTVNDKLEPGNLKCIMCHKDVESVEEKRSITKAKVFCSICLEKKKHNI